MSVQEAVDGDAESRNEIARLLVATLSPDPQAVCPSLAGSCISLLLKPGWGYFSLDDSVKDAAAEYLVEFAQSYPQIIRACHLFIMFPFTLEQRRILCSSYRASCSCDRSKPLVRQLHDRRHIAFQRFTLHLQSVPGSAFIRIILEALNALFDTLQVTPRSDPFHRPPSHHAEVIDDEAMPWPDSPLDVLPYGPETSVRHLCAWALYVPCKSLYNLIHIVTAHAWPRVPRTYLSTVFPMAIQAPGRILVADWDALPAYERYQSASSYIYAFMHMQPLLVEFCQIDPRMIRSIIPSITHATDLPSAAGCCTDVSRALDAMITYAGRQEERDSELVKLFEFASTLFKQAYSIPVDDHAPTLSILACESNLAEDEQYAMLLPLAFYAVHYVRDPEDEVGLRVCGRMGCPNLNDESSGGAGVLCSACHGVWWCSADCTRAALTCPRAPHGPVCDDVGRLVQILAREDGQEGRMLQMYEAETLFDAGVMDQEANRLAEYFCEVYTL